ncbi:Venom factor [Varanus komodoensis]|nr:Venom factor [Varanus komodoensis]
MHCRVIHNNWHTRNRTTPILLIAAASPALAYIAKVFAMASKLVSGIDHNVLCGSVKWLVLERLKPDGMFEEKAPVSSSAMTGGYRYGEPKVSLTAFVLITLLESRDICSSQITWWPPSYGMSPPLSSAWNQFYLFGAL